MAESKEEAEEEDEHYLPKESSRPRIDIGVRRRWGEEKESGHAHHDARKDRSPPSPLFVLATPDVTVRVSHDS